jgi:hypothetical protein
MVCFPTRKMGDTGFELVTPRLVDSIWGVNYAELRGENLGFMRGF